MPETPWGLFVQPDQRSCGAASLVVARFLGDPAYRQLLEGGGTSSPRPVVGGADVTGLRERFQAETLGLHQRITGLADTSGKPQIPWPRKFGTPPWAVARQLSATPGADGTTTPYGWHVARTSLSSAYQRLLDSTRAARVAAVFVGSTWLPRHVVLVVGARGARLEVYDPARGRLHTLDKVAFTGGRIDIAGWDVAWMVVTPGG